MAVPTHRQLAQRTATGGFVPGSGTTWDPDAYRQFHEEQARAANSLVPTDGARVAPATKGPNGKDGEADVEPEDEKSSEGKKAEQNRKDGGKGWWQGVKEGAEKKAKKTFWRGLWSVLGRACGWLKLFLAGLVLAFLGIVLVRKRKAFGDGGVTFMVVAGLAFLVGGAFWFKGVMPLGGWAFFLVYVALLVPLYWAAGHTLGLVGLGLMILLSGIFHLPISWAFAISLTVCLVWVVWGRAAWQKRLTKTKTGGGP
jgi:hypothetical protein